MKVFWRKFKRGIYHITHGMKWNEKGFSHMMSCKHCQDEYYKWKQSKKNKE